MPMNAEVIEMLRFRPYKDCDAETIVSWIGDETAFRKWSADRFDHYPITADDLKAHYHAMDESDSFFPMTAFDESGPVGHMIMRFTDPPKRVLRFGFIIVDSQKRNRGYGREMLRLAIRYAFEMLSVEKITLGVFKNNEQACVCYLKSGFRLLPDGQETFFSIMGENWKCLELEMDRSMSGF